MTEKIILLLGLTSAFTVSAQAAKTTPKDAPIQEVSLPPPTWDTPTTT